ncbi:MAG: MFS transporter [Thermaerobacterales bacterium]
MADTKKLELRQVVKALAAVPAVVAFSNAMLIPILPVIRRALDISAFEASLLLTALSLPSGILLPLGGYLSDRLGRRRVMITGLLVFAAGGALAALTGGLTAPLPWLLLARVLQGAGTAGTTFVAYAVAADLLHDDDRARGLSFLEAVYSTGKLIAPLAGSALALLAWYAPFWIYVPLGITAAAIVWRKVPESHPPERRQQSAAQYGQSLVKIWRIRGAEFIVLMAAGGAAMATWFGALVLLTEHLDALHVRGALRGALISLPLLLFAVSALGGTWTARRLGLALRLRAPAGFILAGLGSLISLFFAPRTVQTLSAATLIPDGFALGPVLWTLAGAAVTGIGIGLALPALDTLVTGKIEEEERGVVSGIYGMARSLGAAAGPPALVFLIGRIADTLVWSGLITLALITAVLISAAIKPGEQEKTEAPR